MSSSAASFVEFGLPQNGRAVPSNSVARSHYEAHSAQRAYEANAKGVQAADEMLRIANNLHRG